MNPKVLIVDDEDYSVDVLRACLGNAFRFDYASSGEKALTAVAADNPAIILMDVEMPGKLNGYEACRALKDNAATHHIPVIFISAHSEAADRLKAYESGGNDYVSKPFNANELKHKFALALANQRERGALAEKVRQAASVAMMSLREAADSGVVLGFLSDIIRQGHLEDIAATTLRTLKRFRIEGAVQLRDGHRHVSSNSGGACTPVEDAVLTEMGNKERIVDLGTRSAFNYTRATIIVYDMPLQDPELYGRLKDTVVKMAEALDMHLRSLAAVNSAIGIGDALLLQLKHNAGVARDISARLTTQCDETHRALQRLAAGIENAAASAGQSASQKTLLENLARDAQVQAQAALTQSVELEKRLAALVTEPDDTPLRNAHAAATAGRVASNDVELF